MLAFDTSSSAIDPSALATYNVLPERKSALAPLMWVELVAAPSINGLVELDTSTTATLLVLAAATYASVLLIATADAPAVAFSFFLSMSLGVFQRRAPS